MQRTSQGPNGGSPLISVFDVHVRTDVTGVLAFLFLLRADARGQILGAVPAGSNRAAACHKTGRAVDPAVTVRGRLFAANGGGSGYRIWPVGTSRILWVSPKIDPPLPGDIENGFKPFDEELYGDYTLIPLARDRPGVMREICFVVGKNLTVRDARTGERRRLKAGTEQPGTSLTKRPGT
jgi:hypothetical protein